MALRRLGGAGIFRLFGLGVVLGCLRRPRLRGDLRLLGAHLRRAHGVLHELHARRAVPGKVSTLLVAKGHEHLVHPFHQAVELAVRDLGQVMRLEGSASLLDCRLIGRGRGDGGDKVLDKLLQLLHWKTSCVCVAITGNHTFKPATRRRVRHEVHAMNGVDRRDIAAWKLLSLRVD